MLFAHQIPKIMTRWLLACLFVTSCLFAPLEAQRDITLEDIWLNGTFSARSVPGFNFLNDGRHYTRLENNQVVQYDLTTGQQTDVLFDASAVSADGFSGDIDGYTFSADESKMLLKTETESIYRRSTKAYFYIYDRATENLTPLFPEGKHMHATLDPTGNKVAFVYENNMYYRDLSTSSVNQITDDGEYNAIINGSADWVYEEEFGFTKAFQWAPDGQSLAFYRFDERAVKEFTMTNYRNELYPEYVTFKYPKVGEENATVQIFIHDLKADKNVRVDVGEETNQYIPRIKWTLDPEKLVVFRMNRWQNELELLLAEAKTGNTQVLLAETNPYYIDMHDNLTFLEDGERFIWTSEQDGWNHIYLYGMDGELIRQITEGEWEVTNFYGVDKANDQVFFQAAAKSPLQREIYRIGLDGSGRVAVAEEDGTNSAQFSSTYDYYVLTHATINTPSSYSVYDRAGKAIRTIEDNQDLADRQKKYGVQPMEFFTFKTKDKVELNGWMLKPDDFNPQQQYPVFMFLYGGPGSQQVTDSWKGDRYWWFQMLAKQGYVVACVDNRGTGARGQEFQKMTYLELGKYETIDQIEAAKYLGNLPYTDASRIGIFGWSYGGYMSSLCLLKGNDVFKAAIAVAPVTNWRWYDTIYTERYMRDEEENPDGYADNSPVNFADRLKGDYLLVHGMGDDNVHFQHTAEMVNALVSANKQFETYFYPNRNHGIYGGNTRLHLYTKMTDFIHRSLGKEMPNAMKKRPAAENKAKQGGSFKKN